MEIAWLVSIVLFPCYVICRGGSFSAAQEHWGMGLFCKVSDIRIGTRVGGQRKALFLDEYDGGV